MISAHTNPKFYLNPKPLRSNPNATGEPVLTDPHTNCLEKVLMCSRYFSS